MSSSLLESYLDFFYAQEILYRLPIVVKRTCQGCLLDSLSQTDHTCLNLTKRQQLSLYFEDVLSEIDEQHIMLKWREAVYPIEDMSPTFIQASKGKALFILHVMIGMLSSHLMQSEIIIYGLVRKCVKLSPFS